MNKTLNIETSGQGLYEITGKIKNELRKLDIKEGLCTIFICHTSASLTIQENADPSARRDLEEWISRHVPEHQNYFTHTAEGADDMPSHIKAALTATSLSIPISSGKLVLGTWQGVYVWEHRTAPHSRRVVVNTVSA